MGKCYCWKIQNKKYNYTRSNTNFCWDKDCWNWRLVFYFCGDVCKNNYVKKINSLKKESLVALAELDESMNYCEFFNRITWNDWIYKRDWFEYSCNWLWDYKSWNTLKAKDFKLQYMKYFWDFNRFKLHNRYLSKSK